MIKIFTVLKEILEKLFICGKPVRIGKGKTSHSISIVLMLFLGLVACNDANPQNATQDPEGTVRSTVELHSALNNVLPGDTLLLANGTYDGFTITRSGKENNPIIIRAANILQVKFSSKISIDADYVWVVGMDMQANPIHVNGRGIRVSQNRFGKVDFPILVNASARNATIDHNEIDHQDTGENANRRGIRMNYKSDGSDYNHHIHHNYLHNTLGENNNAIVSSENGHMKDVNTGTLIEYNLVADWPGGRCVGLKSGWNIIRFNTCLNCNSEEMVNRAGQNNQWIANWIENSGALRIMDINNTAIGNYSPKNGIWLHIGNAYRGGPPPTAGSEYVRVENALIVANTGALSIGERYTTVAPYLNVINTTVEAHNGSISYGLHSGTEVLSTTTREVPVAFKLSIADVGPFAPTAPFKNLSIGK